jgi:predicted GIY-YIG superfamily endonuclease
MGTVYLIHFDKPYKHARHYLGWAQQLNRRLRHHEAGTGARLLQVIREKGITWTVARTWPGDRHLEAELKRDKHNSRMCPICNPRAAANKP